MFDVHCHVYDYEIENAEKIIKECYKKNIKLIINGLDKKSNEEVIKLSKKYSNVYAAIGYSQDVTDSVKDEDFILLEKQIKENDIVAIGEIGIDYHWTKENKERQKEIFVKQIDLAKKYNLPIIVHSREAEEDVYEILKKKDVKGLMHCYSGDYVLARKFISLGYFIGIDGPITFKNNKKQLELLKNIKLDNILLETDSPYLSPEPFRGQTNTPLNLIFIIKKISEIYNISEKEIIEVTNENVVKLFNIGDMYGKV